jgi:hypothetical protein
MMPLLTHIVFEAELALNIADAFSVASEFALAFSIRKMDRENLRIVLNLTSMPSRFVFFTWVKAHVVRVLFQDEHCSLVRVQAKRAVSPHHFLRLPFFWAHRIDPTELARILKAHFGRYETASREKVYDDDFPVRSGGAL